MGTQPLVSIITPCYNGEKYVGKFLDSILSQSHKNIELIFINDGSTDKTEAIALQYKSNIENQGMKFEYIYQENKGVCASINRGLKLFTGDYLIWPDSDHILYKDNILRKVEFLEEEKEYGFVLSRVDVLSEYNMKKIASLYTSSISNNNFLKDVIEKKVIAGFAGIMARTTALLDVLPDREIIEYRAGQNIQIMLPFAYKYKCGYISESLYAYIIRRNSISQSHYSIDDIIKREELVADIKAKTIKKMNIPEESYYLELNDNVCNEGKKRIIKQFEDIREIHEKKKRIVIFGAGFKGYCIALNPLFYGKIAFFIDKCIAIQKSGMGVEGEYYDVFSLEKSLEQLNENMAIIISSSTFREEIYEELLALGVTNKIVIWN